MAFRKKENTSAEVFMLTVPFDRDQNIEDRLDVIFQSLNNLKNALIKDFRIRIFEIEKTRVWRRNQFLLALSYKRIEELETLNKKLKAYPNRLEKLLPGSAGKMSPVIKERVKNFRERIKLHKSLVSKELKYWKKKLADCFKLRNEMIERAGITKGACEKLMAKKRHHYKKIVHSDVAAKISYDVWNAVEDYLYGNGKQLSFSPIGEFTSMYGKKNTTGIMFNANTRTLTFYDRRNRTVHLHFSKHDPYNYEKEALARPVHFVGIVRRWYPTGWRYFAQICFGGTPPIKVKPETGELLHPIGRGRVGIDPGTQTMAVVGASAAKLAVLAENVESLDKKLRRINRAKDRSRRACNPDVFNEKGEIIPINRLPEHCVVTGRDGKLHRNWVESNRYKKLNALRKYLYANRTLVRQQAHHQLANEILSYGNRFFCEKMNYRALAKRAKETKISKNGKIQSKKRFGKSVSNKAPAEFLRVVQRKVEAMGGTFEYVNTYKLRASQYDHETKDYKKKHLSQRWVKLQHKTVQRDLYSAFLIMCVDESLEAYDQSFIEKSFEDFCKNHDVALSQICIDTAPTSTGMRKAS